ncbi:MAG: FAD-dependent oxidoreductase, partial [Pseudomonadales bacterium]
MSACTATGNSVSNSKQATPRVVIVGGGFAGASCARTLAALQPDVNITLVEPAKTYSACPLSNLVIAGERPLAAQQFRYQAL